MPHWEQAGCTYFVTFRLADSLPAKVFEKRDQIRTEFIKTCGAQLTLAQQATLEERLWNLEEAELDRGFGACPLRRPEVATLVETALRHFDGNRYALGRYVIMPNHVHVLVTPLGEHALPDILHSWKSYTANSINRQLGRQGRLWQEESFDRIVRDDQRLLSFDCYIAANPAQAGLPADAARGGCGSAGIGEPEGDTIQQAGSPLSQAGWKPALLRERGEAALRNGEAAVITLAAGAGSRWTGGAGTCKALHPYAKLAGQHRTFIETHLAKSRRTGRLFGVPVPHVFTTSYLTQGPTAKFLARLKNYGYEGPLLLSPGRSVGLRLIPTERDLRFVWEEMPQQVLDVQQQKVRESLRAALINWARSAGEGGDYTDNVPLQCLHPVGHFYEVPNLFRNGVLARLLTERPHLQHLLLDNIDTLGADLDPALLGQHIASGACLTFEVIARRLEDRGGGLARVNGRPRIVEGLAMPREEDEFRLSYYNSMTTWIHVDKLLAAFGLTRADILAAEAPPLGGQASSLPRPVGFQPAEKPAAHSDPQAGSPLSLGRLEACPPSEKITAAIRTLAGRLPTYVTIKDVKKRWGHGQEDVFPVAQFEKLWGDLTALPEIESRFVVVPRLRGQQLKDQAQLDGWLRDGSAAHVESLCEWE